MSRTTGSRDQAASAFALRDYGVTWGVGGDRMTQTSRGACGGGNTSNKTGKSSYTIRLTRMFQSGNLHSRGVNNWSAEVLGGCYGKLSRR
jgi:hypothetical protein